MPSSGYTAISFTAGEQPTTAKWNLVGSNDASFNTGNGFNDGVIVTRHIASGIQLRPSENLPYKFSAYLNSAQTPIAASWTLVNLNTISWDSGSNFNTATHLFTAPIAGFYTFKGMITYGAMSAGTLFGLSFAKNKSTSTIVAPDAQMTFTAGGTAQPESAFYSKDFQLAANDTIALYVFGPANALDIGSAPFYTYMEGSLLSAT